MTRGDGLRTLSPIQPLSDLDASRSFIAGVIERHNAALAARACDGGAARGSASLGCGLVGLGSFLAGAEQPQRVWAPLRPRCEWGGVCAHLAAAADFGSAVEAWGRVRQVRARAAAVTRALADAGWGELAVGLFEWLRSLPAVLSSGVPGARATGGGGAIDAACEDVARACDELFRALRAIRAARDGPGTISAFGVLAAYLEDGHVDTPFGTRIVHPAAVVELAGLCAQGVLQP